MQIKIFNLKILTEFPYTLLKFFYRTITNEPAAQPDPDTEKYPKTTPQILLSLLVTTPSTILDEGEEEREPSCK